MKRASHTSFFFFTVTYRGRRDADHMVGFFYKNDYLQCRRVECKDAFDPGPADLSEGKVDSAKRLWDAGTDTPRVIEPPECDTLGS